MNHPRRPSSRLVQRLFSTHPPSTNSATARPFITLTFRRGSRVLALVSFVAATTQELRCLSPPSSCMPAAPPQRRRTSAKANPNDGSGDEDDIGILARALGPVGGDITMGAIVGFASGFSLKKIGKAAAFFIGLSFLASQTLSHMGYLQIDWRLIERQLLSLLDLDGDAQLTRRDLEIWWGKFKAAMTHQLPSTTGFVTGFALGLHKG